MTNRRVLVLLALGGLWIAACTTPTAASTATPVPSATPAAPTATPIPPSPTPVPSTSTPAIENVTFTTEDGVELDGRIFGQGTTWVILVHMLQSNQQTWSEFAELARQEGVAVLTFDMRGHGNSGGSRDAEEFPLDVAAAIGLAEARGAEGVILMGASMGGAAVIESGAAASVRGVVAISAPSVDPLRWDAQDLMSITAPKLFVATQEDTDGYYVQLVEYFDTWAPEPKESRVFPGAAHGTDLFADSAIRQEFIELLLEFIRTHK